MKRRRSLRKQSGLKYQRSKHSFFQQLTSSRSVSILRVSLCRSLGTNFPTNSALVLWKPAWSLDSLQTPDQKGTMVKKSQADSAPTTTQSFNPTLSPLLNAKPLNNGQPMEIAIELIDLDETNPGIVKDKTEQTIRYRRRGPNIIESYAILGGPLYPVIVCKLPNGRYLLVDGHGRFEEVDTSKVKFLRAIVFPEMSLEQRICLREILNAAQEPFDAGLILKDLRMLAKERGLNVRNEDHMDKLLADLPQRVRGQRDNLLMLARWPEVLADKISVEGKKGTIGIDQVNNLTQLVQAIEDKYPEITNDYPGDKLHHRVLERYFEGAFREEGRAQDNIRFVTRTVKTMAKKQYSVLLNFISGENTLAQFRATIVPTKATKGGKKSSTQNLEDDDLISRFLKMTHAIVDAADSLSDVEKQFVAANANLILERLKSLKVVGVA